MNWDLSDMRPGIKALMSSLSGLVALWEDEPRGFTPAGPQAICLISTTSNVGIGRDERIVNYDPTQALGQELQDEWRGLRKLTFTIKVESEIQTDTGSADRYLELIRSGLNFDSSSDALHVIRCGLIRVLQTVDLGQTRDQRKASIRAFDLLLTARTVRVDPRRYPYIETVAPPIGRLI